LSRSVHNELEWGIPGCSCLKKNDEIPIPPVIIGDIAKSINVNEDLKEQNEMP